MSSFTLYIIGFVILLAGLSAAAVLIGVPAKWIGVGALIVTGVGVISGVAHTRRKDVTRP